jgi:hypothetical protein
VLSKLNIFAQPFASNNVHNVNDIYNIMDENSSPVLSYLNVNAHIFTLYDVSVSGLENNC